ncbi:MAG: hypothetical protein DWQ30_01395 [Acidobacteria bacterium]|nr:MAG: hypothetical protein DWQ30_01395 [Acidobacteriota bacterium]
MATNRASTRSGPEKSSPRAPPRGERRTGSSSPPGGSGRDRSAASVPTCEASWVSANAWSSRSHGVRVLGRRAESAMAAPSHRRAAALPEGSSPPFGVLFSQSPGLDHLPRSRWPRKPEPAVERLPWGTHERSRRSPRGAWEHRPTARARGRTRGATMLQDIRFALRTLLKQRWITGLVIACLALVVAGNTAVFAILQSYILRPLPFPDPDELVMIWERDTRTGAAGNVSVANYLDYRSRASSLGSLAAVASGSFNLTGDGPPELLEAYVVSPELLPMLGGTVERGRAFVDADSTPGAAPVAILTHDLWQSRFGGREDIVGSTILIDRAPTEVVGVLPQSFEFLSWTTDIWLPLELDAASAERAERSLDYLLGRLAPGHNEVTAGEDLASIASELERLFPEPNRDRTAVVRLLNDQVPGPEDEMLFSLIQGAGLFVLLIACANIGNLLLARGQARRRELAMRSALGAGKTRILRQLLTESVVLAMLGGLLGTGLGFLLIRFLHSALAAGLPQAILPVMDAGVLTFSLGISAAAGLVFGMIPAAQAVRGRLVGELRQGSGHGSSGGRNRLSQAFVVAEVALAVALLSGAGVLLWAFWDVQYGAQGFDSDGVMTFSLTLPPNDYPDEESRLRLQETLRRELGSLPGVVAVSSATTTPRQRNVPMTTVEVVGEETVDGGTPRTTWLAIDPGYLDALGLVLLQGRDFEPADRSGAAPVALVDEQFAARFFPDSSPLGERVRLLEREVEIVGVVQAVRHRRVGVIDGPSEVVYLPYQQHPTARFAWLLRVEGARPEQIADPLRAAVWSADPALPVGGLMTLDESIARSLTGIDIFLYIVGAFALFALVLAAMGLYGVLAYSVSQRRQEIGVRMAMGAGRGSVLRLIVRQGLRLTVIGLLIGAPMAFAIRRLIVGSLGELASTPVVLLPLIVATLVLVALAATWIPARRASGLAPTLALRE